MRLRDRHDRNVADATLPPSADPDGSEEQILGAGLGGRHDGDAVAIKSPTVSPDDVDLS
jgi:hypothetical protein